MAYAATISWTKTRVSGRDMIRIRIQEAEAASTSEWKTSNTAVTNPVTGVQGGDDDDVPLPQNGTITLIQSTLTSGTGTTIAPVLGKVASFVANTKDELSDSPAANGWHNIATQIPYSFPPGVKPVIYGRSTPNNAAADHTIDTLIVVIEGHH
jgi:hypothetical protein